MPSHRSGAINWPHSLTSTIKWSGRLEIGSLYSEALLLDLLRRPITCRKLMVNKAIKPRIQEVIEKKLFQLIVKSCWKDFRFVVICGWWMKRWIKEWLPRIKAAILGGNVRGRGRGHIKSQRIISTETNWTFCLLPCGVKVKVFTALGITSTLQ